VHFGNFARQDCGPVSRRAFVIVTAIVTAVLFLASVSLLRVSNDQIDACVDIYNTPREADGCRYVYLDCGTNLGVQIRKLFQLELYPAYPASPILPFFDQYFPRDIRHEVSAFGFEPNPAQKKRLDTLEGKYGAMGWRVDIKRLALSDRDTGPGEGVDFYIDLGDEIFGMDGMPWPEPKQTRSLVMSSFKP